MLDFVNPIRPRGRLMGGARQTGGDKAGLQGGAVGHHAKATSVDGRARDITNPWAISTRLNLTALHVSARWGIERADAQPRHFAVMDY